MDSSLWLIACGVGALLVRVGLALYATGMMRAKNSAGMMVRHLADLSLAVLAFWLVGGAILGAQAGQPIAWNLMARPAENASPFLFFALCTTLISTGIVVGVAGERSRFFPMIFLPILLGGFLVPVAWRWIWTDGWLGRLGFRDLGGVSAIHLVGGVCALGVAVWVGPRSGKYNRDGSANGIPGHSIPLASTGLLLLGVGWFAYVLGFVEVDFAVDSALVGRIALNILLAGAAGVASSLLISHCRYLKPDIHLAYDGWLGALVAIGAGADLGSGWVAVFIGAVAGIIVPLAAIVLDLVWHVDDPTGAVAIHGLGAIWGVLAAGVFAPVESVSARLQVIGVQVLGLAAIALLAAGLSVGLLLGLKRAVGLRSKEADEYDGLDLAEHDIGAYPDFQQTMIKSYHLREA